MAGVLVVVGGLAYRSDFSAKIFFLSQNQDPQTLFLFPLHILLFILDSSWVQFKQYFGYWPSENRMQVSEMFLHICAHCIEFMLANIFGHHQAWSIDNVVQDVGMILKVAQAMLSCVNWIEHRAQLA